MARTLTLRLEITTVAVSRSRLLVPVLVRSDIRNQSFGKAARQFVGLRKLPQKRLIHRQWSPLPWNLDAERFSGPEGRLHAALIDRQRRGEILLAGLGTFLARFNGELLFVAAKLPPIRSSTASVCFSSFLLETDRVRTD